MARAKRMSLDELESVRSALLRCGGVAFKRMCPRPDCHSVVVKHGDKVVCLTCGWYRHARSWGDREVPFSASQALEGSRASYRAMTSFVDPGRWSLLAKRAKKRGDRAAAKRFGQIERELSARCRQPAPPTAQLSGCVPAAKIAGPTGTLQLCYSPKLDDRAPEVLIYTDGGCEPNPGPGGWAAILWSQGHELELAGGDRQTTNNRMELTAALQGLRALTRPSRVTILTDSQYLFNGVTDWITKWSRNGWLRNGEPIPNRDLWQVLARECMKHQTSWLWIRAHRGQAENERCDRLARQLLGQPSSDPLGTVQHRQRRQRTEAPPKLAGVPTAPVWLPAQ